jgi:hypothetical protein
MDKLASYFSIVNLLCSRTFVKRRDAGCDIYTVRVCEVGRSWRENIENLVRKK